MDVAGQAALVALNVDDDAMKRFDTELSKAWGDDVASAAMNSRRFILETRSLRNSSWRTTRDEQQGKRSYRLWFRGESGKFAQPEGDVQGQLEHAHYFREKDGVTLQGFWQLADERGWFRFSYDPREPGVLTGEWGGGEKIGAGEPFGAWNGERGLQN